MSSEEASPWQLRMESYRESWSAPAADADIVVVAEAVPALMPSGRLAIPVEELGVPIQELI